ncbi:MAG: amidohydrolase family protein [Proteobacteria bacterium]|nr:amidohydrolase family protein [Candidatus Enterousia scatequi]
MLLLKRVLLDGHQVDILVDKNRFAQIADEIKPDNLMQVMDCDGKAILPSFANMHTHASMMFLRGIGEDKDLFSWLQTEIWPREAKLNEDYVYHLSRFAVLEMIKSGTTLFNDMYFYENATIRAVDEMGIRAMIPHLFMDFFDDAKTSEHIVIAEQFLNTPVPCDRIIKGLACHAIYTTSQRAFQSAHDLAKKYNTYLHVHISETQQEVTDCIAKYAVRPIELLDKWGVLDRNTLLAHAVHLNDDERYIVHNAGASLIHCPASNMKLNSGAFNLQCCLDSRLPIALGTDGVSSNNSLSMLSEMKIAALLAKESAKSECAGAVCDVFDAATRTGFAVAGLNGGQIQVGCLADFILVDLNNVFLMPGYNIKSDIIYSADTSCIRDVFCNGVPVMRNGIVKDEDSIRENFRKVCTQLF